MKKSELRKIIREELQNLTESNELKISTLTWDEVSAYTSHGRVTLPKEIGMGITIGTETQFNDWKREFTKRYGNVGKLEINGYGTISVKRGSNSKWDKANDDMANIMSKHYSGTGKYTGD